MTDVLPCVTLLATSLHNAHIQTQARNVYHSICAAAAEHPSPVELVVWGNPFVANFGT